MSLYITYFLVGVVTVVTVFTSTWIVKNYGDSIYSHTLGHIPWEMIKVGIVGIVAIVLVVLVCVWIGWVILEYVLPFINYVIDFFLNL